METLIAWGLTTLVGSFIGSYLASYLKKKGENRAIREDLADLLKQVRAVTTTTKEIEAKISTEVWDRQKRWEMKRDVLFEATKRLVELEKALMKLETTFDAVRKNLPNVAVELLQLKLEASEKWNDSVTRFEESFLLVGIACGNEMKAAGDDYKLTIGKTASGIFNDDPEIYDNSVKDLGAKFLVVERAIRKELETDKPG
jgi:hypothetical protein